MRLNFITVVILLFGVINSNAQGFQNLNFENATIVIDNSQGSPFVYATNAIPHWTTYVSGVPQTDAVYNSVPLSDPQVTLQGANNGLYPPVQGTYFVMLWGQFNPGNYPDFNTNTAAIGQTGQIPLSSLSLTFWGTIGGMQATFNGQPLDFLVTGSIANYTIYSADISAYAGQTGQLLFTDPCYGNNFGGPAIIDNIQFSSSPVPEPSALGLFALGGLSIVFRRWKK